MILVVDDTELPWGHTMNLLLRMYDETPLARRLQRGRMIFGRVANLEGDIE